MGLIKYGTTKIIATYENNTKLLDDYPNLEKILDSFKVIKLDPERYMYVRNRSISSLETWGPNRNGDGFPREDIKKAHHTFINSRVSVDHRDDIIVGVVIDSYFVEPKVEVYNDTLIKRGDYVENIIALDKRVLESYKPDGENSLLKLIIDGLVEDTSMGAIVGYSICSVPTCMNIARTEDEYCEHIKSSKNSVIKVAGILDVPVYEICKEITFFEDSIIVPLNYGGKAGGEGADPSARILEKVATTPLKSYVVYRDRIYKTSQADSPVPIELLKTHQKVIKQKFKDDDIEYTKKVLKNKDDENKKEIVKESQENASSVSVSYDYLIELLKKGVPFDEALKSSWEYFKSLTGLGENSEEVKAAKEPKKAIIVDVDGTVMDISHRLKYIEGEKKDWKKFFDEEEVSKDKVNKEVVEKINKIKQETSLPVVVITGRPENLREITEKQLRESGLDFDELVMKPQERSYEKAVSFKSSLLGMYYPVIAFDDEEAILDAMKKVNPDLKMFLVEDNEVKEYTGEKSEKRSEDLVSDVKIGVWVRKVFK